MKNVIKLCCFIILFITVVIYCIKSVYSFKDAKIKYSKLQPEYISLVKQKENLTLEIQALQIKVQGICEKTLNKDILEERIKIMLNYKNPHEMVVTN